MGLPRISDMSHWDVQGLGTLNEAQEEEERSFFMMRISPRIYFSATIVVHSKGEKVAGNT